MKSLIERMWMKTKSSGKLLSHFPKISLVERRNIISDESKVANSFSNFSKNAIWSLGIKTKEHSHENYGWKNPIEIVIKKFDSN